MRYLSGPQLRLCCFFFQAEDGIRDSGVTGVQTCALPISVGPGARGPAAGSDRAGSSGEARRAALNRARLYLCTADRPDLAEFVTAVCGAGVDIVQLRDKELPDRAVLERAAIAREAAHAAGALFVLNDRPDLAVACGADGVHVGQ